MPTHVIIDAPSFPAAQGYFAASTREKTRSGFLELQSGNIHPERQLTLRGVLNAIVTHTSVGDNVILVCHGTQQGISLDLSQGTTVTANIDALNLLTSGRPAADIAQPLGLSEADVDDLQARMRGVQMRSLRRLEIRGCRIGQWSSTLSAIHRFFGATLTGAPTVRNAYARVGFRLNAREADFDRIRSGAGQIFDVASGRVGYNIDMTAHSAFNFRRPSASSADALRDWQREMFFFRQAQTGEFRIHGQFVNQSLIFPKQSDYTANLAEFCGEDALGIPLACTAP